MPKLAASVPVMNPETHEVDWFGPDDEDLPDWVVDAVTNPAAWDVPAAPVDTPYGPVNSTDVVRNEMVAQAEEAGLDVPANAPVDALARILRNGSSDAATPGAGDGSAETVGAAEDDGLEELSNDELYSRGQDAGAHVTKSMNKAELIEAIREAEADEE